MVEPVSMAVHAVERTPVSLGDTAVVVGAGMVGLLVVQALRVAGCGKIIAVDLEPAEIEAGADARGRRGLKADECDVVARSAKPYPRARG